MVKYLKSDIVNLALYSNTHVDVHAIDSTGRWDDCRMWNKEYCVKHTDKSSAKYF